MKKKSVNFFPGKLGHSHEIVDALYAFYQSQDPKFNSAVDFSMNAFVDKQASINVYLDYMPTERKDFSEFDLILYSNGCEPLSVATEIIQKDILERDNCFLICNSKVADSHPCAKKTIWFPANIMTLRDLWTRYCFPQFHVNYRLQDQIHRHKNIFFINGQNRSWRHHFSKLLSDMCPDIQQHSTISTIVHETNDSFFESDQDSVFRHTVNEMYKDQIVRNSDTDYFHSVPTCGIHGKFGNWPMGYTIMPEYFEHLCVIFPETTWQNDECAITEKILKCFMAGAIPWPIGGSNINSLYNQIGFQTAWNFLPPDMQSFDSEHDHFKRYTYLVKAIGWLASHPEALRTKQAREAIALNRERFLTCHSSVGALDIFRNVIETYLH